MEQPKSYVRFDPKFTTADNIVLKSLVDDLEHYQNKADSKVASPTTASEGFDNVVNDISETSSLWKRTEFPCRSVEHADRNEHALSTLQAMTDSANDHFEPTVFVSVDLKDLRVRLSPFVQDYMLQPYIRYAQRIARNPTDVVMITHLILYFTTTVPSAVYMYYSFHWWHAIAHLLLTVYYMGTYTLMMHQHIHMRGILNKKYWLFDALFPYVTDPLMGHTWNTYYYHHVKHHHVEGNGPDDLSSTIRYQRDDFYHFLHYVGRFFFLIWFDLPRYFIRKQQKGLAVRTAFFEVGNYAFLYYLGFYVNGRATIFVYLLPLLLLRIGLMVGNWGQHAFVDEIEPDSDYRSSITLIDVASNRYSFNDGYHTSHHLNPLRHWRDHPASFVSQKQRYADEDALVLHGIDYIMITVKLLTKDYRHLAERMVPIGSQMDLSVDERAQLLRRKTRAFTKEEIDRKFKKSVPGSPWKMKEQSSAQQAQHIESS